MHLSWAENITAPSWGEEAKIFCAKFCASDVAPRFIFGRNRYTESLIKHFKIDGIIDDFYPEAQFKGIPVYRAENVPQSALVINAVGGKVLTAERRLKALGLQHLDFFAFSAICDCPLPEIRFNEGFREDFVKNKQKYIAVNELLADEVSKECIGKLINFRLSKDISHLSGFSSREHEQYFESFLELNTHGETFIDVGGFDGFTSEEFIRHCPAYAAVHVFEPDENNMRQSRSRLKARSNVKFYEFGVSNFSGTLWTDFAGSETQLCNNGSIQVSVKSLDDCNIVNPSFIKIDVEGGEKEVLIGASEIIRNYHPRIAVAIYHQAGDFWRIPEIILSLRTDYRVYVRHYTESIYETVMFFVPK